MHRAVNCLVTCQIRAVCDSILEVIPAKRKKILILRFSSFGDVTQCLSVPSKIRSFWPDAEIDWIVRNDLKSLLENHPMISKIISFPRKANFKELLSFAWNLRKENYTHVYDAHNSTRSWVISLVLQLTTSAQILRKSQKRIFRIFLFKFKINFYQMPRSGQRDLLEPLQCWGMDSTLPPVPQLFLDSADLQSIKELLPTSAFIALAPSAAYELKRWPLEHWKKLIEIESSMHFVLLGGPEDHFLNEIFLAYPSRVTNLTGKTNLRQTAAVVKKSILLISNDTGILHTAEQLGHPAIALMGPAPFGFPSRPTTSILELDLKCRPCSKHGQGPCVNVEFHKCLKDITPTLVSQTFRKRRLEA